MSNQDNNAPDYSRWAKKFDNVAHITHNRSVGGGVECGKIGALLGNNYATKGMETCPECLKKNRAMRKRKLTPAQEDLLEQIKNRIPVGGVFEFDHMKARVECRSYDNTLNALLHKGYIDHYRGNDENEFTLL